MEKSATNVLLQLIDCIELMKNEVKKKMHADSVRCCTKVTQRSIVKKKIQNSLPQKLAHAKIPDAEIQPAIHRARSPLLVQPESAANLTASRNFILFAHRASIIEVAKLRGSMINGGFR